MQLTSKKYELYFYKQFARGIINMLNNEKSLNITLRIIAVVLIAISFFFLFIPYTTEFVTRTWGVSSYGTRVDLSSDSSYSQHNLFELIRFYDHYGWENEKIIPILIIATLVISLLVSGLSFFKLSKGLLFAFAGFPLVVTILCVIFTLNSIGYEISFSNLGSYAGYNVYSDKTVYFGISVVPIMITTFLAFVCMLVSEIKQSRHSENNINHSIIDTNDEHNESSLGNNDD